MENARRGETIVIYLGQLRTDRDNVIIFDKRDQCEIHDFYMDFDATINNNKIKSLKIARDICATLYYFSIIYDRY